jgi:hypothetical protein
VRGAHGSALPVRPTLKRGRVSPPQPLSFRGVCNLDDPSRHRLVPVPVGQCGRQVELPTGRDPVLGEQRQCNNFGRRALGGHVPKFIQTGSKLHYQDKSGVLPCGSAVGEMSARIGPEPATRRASLLAVLAPCECCARCARGSRVGGVDGVSLGI